MAIDMISESPSLVTSPRISFSDDLCHDEEAADDSAATIEDFSSEFDFCISNNTNTETSSADELFLDGLIRPLQLQEKFVTLKHQVPASNTQALASNESLNQEIMKQETSSTIIVEQKNQNKSFWHIKRSSSLHCVNSHKNKSSFWSLPLLSRSNSTGSVPNSKQSTKGVKQNAQFKNLKNPSSQKPPLRKNYYGGPGTNYYGNGVRINPVLNVPPPSFISKGTANLFGLGSFFDKKSKK